MVLLRRVIGDALRARRQGQHRTLREVSTAANVSLGPMFIWYWKDMLTKAGIKSFPQTTSQLIAAAAALKAKGLPTMALGLNSQALFNFDNTFYTL